MIWKILAYWVAISFVATAFYVVCRLICMRRWTMSELILWEHHKKAICDFYACSDSHDRQYPDCNFKARAGIGGSCKLSEISNLILFLNTRQP